MRDTGIDVIPGKPCLSSTAQLSLVLNVELPEIMKRRRAKDDYIASWFSYQPVSRPAARPSARTLAKARSARG